MSRAPVLFPDDDDDENPLAALETARLRELYAIEAEIARLKGKGAASFLHDPLGFIDAYVQFPPGEGLTAYQRDIIGGFPEAKRLAVRGCRGMGKSTTASLLILGFAATRDAAGIDWKVMTTAGSWHQLESYLWQEITKWARRIDWAKMGRPEPNERTELMKTKFRLKYGFVDAASPDTPQKIEGLHSDHVMVVLDEAKIIDTETFNSVEGALSGARKGSGREAYALAISTPGEPAGRFYDMHRHAKGLENWQARHVTVAEAIAAGRIDPDWVEQMKLLWGESSALYQNHVLGEFCADDEDAIIPLSWVEAAVERWRKWDLDGRPEQDGPRIAGVDIATTGKDHTAIALRYGDVIAGFRTYTRADTMETAGNVKVVLDADHEMRAVVDSRGVGSGTYHRLREMGLKVDPFDASAKATRRDRTGQLSFKNLRAAAWWHCRDLLDPSANATLALPPDDELIGDLTCVHKKIFSDGKILAELKDDVRKRIGRSTDKGDAVIMALWACQDSWLEAYGTTGECTNPKCGEFFRPDLPDGKMRTHCPHCRAKLEEPEEEAA